MKFFDTTTQYKNIKSAINAAITRVIKSGVFIGGPEVENCEAAIARYCGSKYAIALNSGTDALTLSLKALGIGAGDEVITTPFTFIATAASIVNAGATPIFVDIDAQSVNIDPKKIEAKITKKTKAIMPVHLFGMTANMDAIMAIAKKHNLSVVEDAAQAIGAIDHGRKAGSIGDVGCFSFFPSKTLGAYGDGGMAITNNETLAAQIKLLRSHGSSPKEKYTNLIIGTNSRLDALQAAILNVKIKYLDRWITKRQQLAAYYNRELSGIQEITTPSVDVGRTHTYHQYTIRATQRDELKKYLEVAGIPTMIYYPTPLHEQLALQKIAGNEQCPVAETVAHEVLSLPLYPELKRIDQQKIINAIKRFYTEHGTE